MNNVMNGNNQVGNFPSTALIDKTLSGTKMGPDQIAKIRS